MVLCCPKLVVTSRRNNTLCSLILPIAVHLLFQFEIYSFPQEGDKEGAEKSDSYSRGLLEMGGEGSLVRDVDKSGVLISEVLVLEHNCRSAGGVQVGRVRGGRGT